MHCGKRLINLLHLDFPKLVNDTLHIIEVWHLVNAHGIILSSKHIYNYFLDLFYSLFKLKVKLVLVPPDALFVIMLVLRPSGIPLVFLGVGKGGQGLNGCASGVYHLLEGFGNQVFLLGSEFNSSESAHFNFPFF